MVSTTSASDGGQTPNALLTVHLRVVAMGDPPGTSCGNPVTVDVGEVGVVITMDPGGPTMVHVPVPPLFTAVAAKVAEVVHRLGWAGPAAAAAG